MRRIITYLWAVSLSLAAVVFTSCGGDDSMNLIFDQGQSSCAATPQSTAMIQCADGSIIFAGSVITPNPCYYLKARLDVVNQSNVQIVITAMSQSGEDNYCIECLGEITFSGMLEMSGACGRSLSVAYNGDIIAEYESR